jgi:hypothetical protein
MVWKLSRRGEESPGVKCLRRDEAAVEDSIFSLSRYLTRVLQGLAFAAVRALAAARRSGRETVVGNN